MLREESLDAQTCIDKVKVRKAKLKRRMLTIIKILDTWLGKLPKHEIEKFWASEDFVKYKKFYDKYIRQEG